MPLPALIGTYPLPGMQGATVTAGLEPARAELARIFRNGPVDLAEDIETYGLGVDAQRVKCVTFGTEDAAVVLDPRDAASAAEIRRAQDYALTLTMHNGTFDAPNLAMISNCPIGPLFHLGLVPKIRDTILRARLATPGLKPMKDLDSCVERYLGIKNAPITDLFKALGYRTKLEGFLKLDIDAPAYLFGAGADAVGTARLMPVIHAAAVDRQLNHPFPAPIGLGRAEAEEMIRDREEHHHWSIEQTIIGLKIDAEYVDRFRAINQAGLDQKRAYLRSLGVENANQLAAFLQGIGALPPGYPRTKKTLALSTKAEDLQGLGHPLARMWAGLEGPDGKILEFGITQLEKLDGYLQKALDEMDANGRVHPVTSVLKAAHGRDAMSGLPIHQFPELARPVIAADTSFTSIDFSQQEPRITMNLAGDIGPLQPYERDGIKIYAPIAQLADITMDAAKIVVLAGLYGRGLGATSTQLGLPPDPWVEEWVTRNGRVIEAHWGYEAAKDIQAAVFGAIPRTAAFMEAGKRIARDHELAWTISGRIVPIPSGFFQGRFSVQAHKWINYNTSGSANDELSHVIVTARRQGLGNAIRFGMHDEVVVESEAAHDIRRIAETPHPRLCLLSGRRPVIRTDMKVLGKAWDKA